MQSLRKGTLMDRIGLNGNLPSGETFRAVVALDEIALRVGDGICVAHRQWMTPDEARRVAAALTELAAPR